MMQGKEMVGYCMQEVRLKPGLLTYKIVESRAGLSTSTIFSMLFSVYQSSRRFQSMLHERQKLPAWQERETILDFMKSYQVLVVSGMTG